jgi:uncharacterized membrane protein
VLTKIDAITNYQKIIDSNREKLSNSLNLSPEQISLIPVSSKAKQEYLKYKDPEDLEESHFLQLQEKIWSLVKEQRGQILLLKALTELGKALTQIKRPLEVEWQSYQQRSQQELDQWEQDIKKIQKQLQDLLQNNAEWQTHLRDGLEIIRLDAQNEFHNGFVQLQRRSTKYLDDPAFLNNPQQIAILLESDIDAMMTELSKKLNSKAATLYGQIEERSGLNFNPFAATSLEPEHAHFALDEIQIKKSSVDEKALTFGRSGLSNMSGLGFAGSLVGGIIGGLIGTFLSPGVGTVGGAQLGAAIGGGLGALAGTTRGVIEGVQQVAKQDQTLAKQEISKILRQYLEDSQRLCMQTLNQSIKSLEKFMRDELTSQIKRQKESYDKTLQSLQQARKLSQEQGSQRANQLQTPLKKLMQMQQEVEQLAIAVTTQSENRQPKAKPQTSLKSPRKEPVTVDAHADYGDWADG